MKLMYRFTTSMAAVAALCCIGCSESEPKNDQQALEELRRERQSLDSRIADLEKKVGAQSSDTAGNQRQIPVSTIAVAPETFRHFISVQGMVETDKLAQVSPKTPGTITKIYVQEGSRVSAGQALAEIDNSIAEAQVQTVQAQYDFAKTVYEKQKRVWEQKAGSEIEYLQAKNNMETLAKQLAAVKEQAAMGTIRAPFAGVVDKVVPKVGESVSPGMEAFRVVNLSNLRVTADVSEAYLGKIQRGSSVQIRFSDLNREVEAKVGTVSQAVDPTNRTFSIGIPLGGSTQGIRPNMICVVNINDVTIENSLTVPINAVRSMDGKNYLFVVKEENGQQTARIREVVTGLSSGGKIEIKSGIEAGDNIVTMGANDLADGDIVRVM